MLHKHRARCAKTAICLYTGDFLKYIMLSIYKDAKHKIDRFNFSCLSYVCICLHTHTLKVFNPGYRDLQSWRFCIFPFTTARKKNLFTSIFFALISYKLILLFPFYQHQLAPFVAKTSVCSCRTVSPLNECIVAFICWGCCEDIKHEFCVISAM